MIGRELVECRRVVSDSGCWFDRTLPYELKRLARPPAQCLTSLRVWRWCVRTFPRLPDRCIKAGYSEPNGFPSYQSFPSEGKWDTGFCSRILSFIYINPCVKSYVGSIVWLVCIQYKTTTDTSSRTFEFDATVFGVGMCIYQRLCSGRYNRELEY